MEPSEPKKAKKEKSKVIEKSEGQKRYEAFVEAYVSSSDDAKDIATRKAQKQWNLVKHDQTEIAKKIAEFKQKATQKKAKSEAFWIGFRAKTPAPKIEKKNEETIPVVEKAPIEAQKPEIYIDIEESVREKPVQEKLEKEINLLKSDLLSKKQMFNSPLSSNVKYEEIEKVEKSIKEKELHLKKLKRDSKWQKNKRTKFKEVVKEICENNEEVAEKLKSFNRESVGRPRIEVDQPGLLSAILDLVQAQSASDDKRRTERLRSIQTLG